MLNAEVLNAEVSCQLSSCRLTSAFKLQPSALFYLGALSRPSADLALAGAGAPHLAAFPHDLGDPVLNTWILWWNTQAVPFTERWWSAPIFYPVPGALALSEHLFGIAVFTAPLQFAGLQRRSAPTTSR